MNHFISSVVLCSRRQFVDYFRAVSSVHFQHIDASRCVWLCFLSHNDVILRLNMHADFNRDFLSPLLEANAGV